MTDEIDQLKAFEEEAQRSLTKRRIFFEGPNALAEMREYQRQQKAVEALEAKRTARRIERERLYAAILADTGSNMEIAERHGVASITVARIRKSRGK